MSNKLVIVKWNSSKKQWVVDTDSEHILVYQRGSVLELTVSNIRVLEPSPVDACKIALQWLERAPLDLIHAIEEAIREHNPMGVLDAAIRKEVAA